MSVPATRLYSSYGIGWPAAIAAVLATLSVVAIVLSSRGDLISRDRRW